MLQRIFPVLLILLLAVLPGLAGMVSAASSPDMEAARIAARKAVEKALPLLEKSSAEYTRQRGCFSCHHQAMPVFALSIARAHGFPVDETNFQAQLKFTE